MELNTPPPERFLRGRQKRARPTRRLGKLLLKTAGLMVGLFALIAAFVWTVAAAGRAPELAVHRVLVEGNEQLSDGEILELIEFSERANILMLDLEEVRANLLRSAWVADVEIERVLPATLELSIRERRPVAVAVLDELYLMASDGTMLDQLSPSYDIAELVLVRGLRDGDGLDPDRATVAGRLSAELVADAKLGHLVSEVDVGDGRESVSLRLREPSVTLLVAADDMVDRLTEIVPLLDGLQNRYPEIDVVDLRFRGRTYLRLREDKVSTVPAEGEIYTRAVFASGGAPF